MPQDGPPAALRHGPGPTPAESLRDGDRTVLDTALAASVGPDRANKDQPYQYSKSFHWMTAPVAGARRRAGLTTLEILYHSLEETAQL